MSSGKTTVADSKLNPQMLLERGTDFFQHGDYYAARRDFKLLLMQNPTVDAEKKAREMLRKTSIDPIEVIAGLAVLGLLIFLFIYFGLHR
jgi:hypothetical protein